MGDFEGNFAYAKYSRFSIGPESDGCKLEVGGYFGNACNDGSIDFLQDWYEYKKNIQLSDRKVLANK